MIFHQTKLPNGLELIGEANADARSTAVGFLVRTGARDESAEINGVSHFLEHMVFKGTPRRSALDVNREFDEIGARYNAFTSEENTVFWGAVLPEYLPRLVDLLADLMRPSLRPDDFDTEKKVILEEIGMYDDQPMWKAYEKIMRRHFGEHPLGNCVLGTTASVGGLAATAMRAYFDRRYVAGNMLVAAAGKFDWDELCGLFTGPCSAWPGGPAPREAKPAAGSGEFIVLTDAKIKQEHIVVMSGAPSAESPDRFAADVLATAVGDGTASRLFWEFVDPGHAETAELEYHEFQGAGAFMTYLTCDPEEAVANLDRLRTLLRKVSAENIRPDELEQVKNKAAARIVLRSERPMGRLMPLGFNWLYRREYRSIDDDLASLRAVSLDDVRRVLDEHPLDRVTTVTIGPMKEDEYNGEPPQK